MAGCLAFRRSLRRRNDNLPVPRCPRERSANNPWVFAASSRDSGGKSVDSADLSAMSTVFPGVCSAAAAAVGSSVAVHPTLMSIITPARWK